MRDEKAAREGRRVTQREVADALEVPHVYVSRWETGRNVPERYAVAQLAKFYGVPEGDLMELREADVLDSDGRRLPAAAASSPGAGGDRREDRRHTAVAGTLTLWRRAATREEAIHAARGPVRRAATHGQHVRRVPSW